MMKLTTMLLPITVLTTTAGAQPGSAAPAFTPEAPCWQTTSSAVQVRWSDKGCTTRVLQEISNREIPPHVVPGLLGTADQLESPKDLAKFLTAAAMNYQLDADAQRSFLQHVDRLAADARRQEALTTLVYSGAVTPEVLPDLLETARGIRSDKHLALLLGQVARIYRVDDASRAAFFRAADTIQSRSYRRQVDDALAFEAPAA